MSYLIAGKPDESYLIELVTGIDGQPPEMPKDAPALTDEQIAVLRKMDRRGRGLARRTLCSTRRRKADASWWSLQPIQPTSHTSIDQFLEVTACKQDNLVF